MTGFRNRLLQIGFVGFAGALLIGLASWYAERTFNSALEVTERYAKVLRNHVEGDMMHDALRADVQRALWIAIEKNSSDIDSVKHDVRAHGKHFRERIQENKKYELSPSAKSALAEIDAPLEKYITAAEAHVDLALSDLNAERAQLPMFNESFSELEGKMAAVSDKLQAAQAMDIAEVQKKVSVATWVQIIVVLFSGAGCLILALRIANGVMSELGGEPADAVAAAKRIAAGDFDDNINLARAPKNSLLGQMEFMRAQLRSSAATAVENFRIRQALSATSSNVMLADAQRNIIYMNKSVEKMLREAESDLRKALPHFSVNKVIGSNMDIFHKNPAHQSHLLANLRETYVGNILVAGRSFRLIANPIFSDSGERLGSVVEWLDRTKEVAAEHELSRILGALETTTTNLMIADNDRKIIYLNKSVETMLRNAESDIRSALPHFAVDKVLGNNMDIFHKNPAHQMKLLESLTGSYTSNIVVGTRHFRLIANPIFSKDGSRLGSVVEWLDRTQEVFVETEVNQLVEAAAAGNFTTRLSTQGKNGFFLKLAEGLNQLVGTADKGLNDVTRVLGAISQGDLTEKIQDDYSGTFGELKNYCNQTTASLSEMLGDIRIAADTIFTASSEIAQGNADLSSRTEQQAANLEETASSMEELTSTVRLNADNAKQANVLAEQAAHVATNGGELIQEVVVTMNTINESSQRIADIIGVIDGIAFQTNILALNAAVEAARAGDQGRGFAVVASEVRTLAQRSANAAKDIKSLISDSVKKIESGNALVDKSGETMKEIVTAIKRVNDIMAEIAAASSEQSAGIEEVSTAVSQMDEMTQQNAALVEQAAAAAESLQSQADQLTQGVAQFKLDVNMKAISRPSPQLPKPVKTQQTLASAKLPASKNQEDEWESF